MSTVDISKPTVHLNGTSRQALLADYERVLSHLQEAVEALNAAAPNARDYYPQGPAAWLKASKEHRARDEALHGVLGELQAIYEHVTESK